ncbi:MAG: hypothetical protein J5I59_12270 [Saprospiraceae bacterium]|nr:hypothetical protein [Saprospiraceae bacterium]
MLRQAQYAIQRDWLMDCVSLRWITIFFVGWVADFWPEYSNGQGLNEFFDPFFCIGCSSVC